MGYMEDAALANYKFAHESLTMTVQDMIDKIISEYGEVSVPVQWNGFFVRETIIPKEQFQKSVGEFQRVTVYFDPVIDDNGNTWYSKGFTAYQAVPEQDFLHTNYFGVLRREYWPKLV